MISRVKKYYLTEAMYIVLSFIFLTTLYILRDDVVRDFPTLRGIITSFVFGSVVAVFELFIAPRKFEKYSFSKTILIRVGFYVFFFSIAIMIFTYMTLVFKFGKSYAEFLSSDTISLIRREMGKGLAYMLFTVFIINFIRQLNKLLGQRVLYNYIRGKYHDPIHEEMVFLFLDLNNSTTIAEKIGEIKYHKFIKTFFEDLTYPVLECDATIFQYVGDEVVFVWDGEKGCANNNCITLHGKIKERVEQRKEYYKKEFGVIPTFKSAVHAGQTVVGEVGVIKSEIVYHGDVLNAASRILDLCKETNREQLFSEVIKERLNLNEGMAKYVGTYQFRGKKKELSVYELKD